MPREKHLPPVAPKGGGKAFFVSPKTMELIKKFLGRTDVEMDAAQFEMNEKNGVRHYRLKERPQQPQKTGGGGAAAIAPLTPYLFTSGEDKKLAITAGLIDSITPTFDAELLTADPAPSVTITAATKLWLVLEFEPESENEGALHWIAPGGTLISAEFELSATQPAETAANVTEAGVVTNGVYSILWAEITVVSDVLTLAVTRTGNRITGFCPPNVLTYYPG